MRECRRKISKTLSTTDASNFSLENITTLIIEDNRIDQEILSQIITKKGGSVLLASHGEVGFNIAIESIPDLIILDFFLPDENGDELCQRIKKNERTKRIPLIFLTVNHKVDDMINCLDFGAQGFFEKPIDREIMISEIKFLLQNTEI